MVQLLIFLTASQLSWAGPTYDELVKDLPQDVVAVIDRRIGCNNVEDNDEDTSHKAAVEDKADQSNKIANRFKCTTLAADEKALRSKYKKQSEILEALDEAKTLTPAD